MSTYMCIYMLILTWTLSPRLMMLLTLAHRCRHVLYIQLCIREKVHLFVSGPCWSLISGMSTHPFVGSSIRLSPRSLVRSSLGPSVQWSVFPSVCTPGKNVWSVKQLVRLTVILLTTEDASFSTKSGFSYLLESMFSQGKKNQNVDRKEAAGDHETNKLGRMGISLFGFKNKYCAKSQR